MGLFLKQTKKIQTKLFWIIIDEILSPWKKSALVVQWYIAISSHFCKIIAVYKLDTHNGWIEWLIDNLSFRFTGKDKNCCKHITIDMHYYEREKHTCWLLYLFVWLIHVQPLRFASWWGLKQDIQQNQLSSLHNQVSAPCSINLRFSYSLNHRNLISQTRKCSCIHPLFLYPHTHSHSIQAQYHCTNF